MAKRVYIESFDDYELIDAGNHQKLEKLGSFTVIRPEQMAYFRTKLPLHNWRKKACAEFLESKGQSGKWHSHKKSLPDEGWTIKLMGFKLLLKPTRFKHLGVFPEQLYNWKTLQRNIKGGDKVLNLFSYTGMNSLISASSGADTFHVDSSASVVKWASENAKRNKLDGIHWVVEDALKFLKKEVKRHHFYEIITMDPPAFGIGAKKERWKIEKLLPELIEYASKALRPSGLLILNTYSQKVDEKYLRELTLKNFGPVQLKVNTLSLKSKSGKIIDTGLVTHIRKDKY